MKAQVAIIGAGISGLICANELLKYNVDVQLFEKGRHAGGRVATRFASRTDASAYFDHGAQYFTARSEIFQNEVRSLVANNAAALWNGRIGKVREGVFEAEQHVHERYVGVPYMRSVPEYLARKVNVHTERRVKCIDIDERKYKLQFEDGSTSPEFDAVVVAVPPAQAALLIENFADLQALTSSIKMAACWATFVSLRSRLQIPFDGLFVSNASLSWICRDSSKPFRPGGERWVLHSTHEWADEHVNLSADEVSTILLGELFRVTKQESISAEYIKSHRWLYAIPQEEQSFEILQSGCLVICGDWCSSGRVEGAFLSGRRAASAVLNLLR